MSWKIIEGAITIAFGTLAWFYLSDFPDKNTFLSKEQTKFVLERVERDRGDSMPDTLTKEKLINHLLDWRVWAFGMVYSRLKAMSLIACFSTDVYVRYCTGLRYWVKLSFYVD